jgi:carbamoyl-phosphate synthase large subunit
MSRERQRVLITGMGGPSGISILRGIAGEPDLEVVSADLDPYAAGLYLVGADRRTLLPRGDDPGFVDALLDVAVRLRARLIVPTVDSELPGVARARDRFQESGIGLVVASPETLSTCLDKWVLHGRCRATVRVPETWLVDERFDPEAPPLPVIVKPRSGSGSRGIRLITAREDLRALPPDGTQLVQEHLPGAEYSLDVLAASDGQVAAVVPRERLKVDSGIAITGRTLHDERLETYGRTVAGLIGLTTVANVQVKLDTTGEPALLEVNPRFPGTMPLTIAAGINMPLLAIREALGTPIPQGPLAFEDVAMVRYFEERFFGFDEITELREDPR